MLELMVSIDPSITFLKLRTRCSDVVMALLLFTLILEAVTLLREIVFHF